MRETRSRTSAGPRRFMGGEAMSAYRTAPSLRTLRVSKTLSPAGAAFTCDGSGLVGPEAATGPAAVPLRSRCRGSMSSVSLTVAMPASNAEKLPQRKNKRRALCARLEDRRFQPGLRSDLNEARISETKDAGCSQAAKWPPLGRLL